MKTKFYDRHDHIDYLKACEMARRIVADPAVIADARRWVEQVIAADPHQRRYAEMWRALLDRPPAEIAAALVQDSEHSQLLRETRPIFGKGFTSQEVFRLIADAGLSRTAKDDPEDR